MEYQYYNWFVTCVGTNPPYECTKTVLYGSADTRGKGDLKWSRLADVSTYANGEVEAADLVQLNLHSLKVNGETVKPIVKRSIGNSGNSGEKTAVRGFFLLSVTFEGREYLKWFIVSDKDSLGNLKMEPVPADVGASIFKMKGFTTHDNVPVFNVMRECLPMTVQAISVTTGLYDRPWGKASLRGENISILGSVWTRIGPSGTVGKPTGTIAHNVVHSWTRPMIDIGAAVRVTDEEDENLFFSLRAGRYFLPVGWEDNPSNKVSRMVILSMGGTMNRMKSAIGSATNVGLASSTKKNTRRTLRRL